jgi:hypothetical protein
MRFGARTTPTLHYSIIPFFSQITFLPVILRRSRVQRNLEWTFFCIAAEHSHVQRLVIIDGNHTLSVIHRLNRSVGQSVWQPAVRHQRPAAKINAQYVIFELPVTRLR